MAVTVEMGADGEDDPRIQRGTRGGMSQVA